MFQFGDRQSFKPMKLVTIPAKIGSKNDSKLPLLLSRKEMKKTKAKIEFNNDVILFFGQDINT